MRKAFGVLFIILVAFACNQETEYDLPLIFTGEVTGIDTTGAVFHGKITDLGSESVAEYGFVWDSGQDPVVGSAEQLVVRQSPREGTFQLKVATTLEDEMLYFVRAYMKTAHSITYGKEVTFTSLGSKAPTVTDVAPNPANLEDTVVITGKNFSYRLSGNVVRFNEWKADVIKGNQDTLWVVVPNELDTVASDISVSILENKGTAEKPFRLITPKIADFSPKTGTFGSLITITGVNFLSHPSSFHAWVGDLEVVPVDYQDDRLVVAVPDSLNERAVHIRLGMNNLIVSSVETFTLEGFTLFDFSPKTALTGETIVITGNNFSPVTSHNRVNVGGLDAAVKQASLHELSIVLPMQDKGYYDARDNNVRIEVIGENHEFTEKLHVNDRWFRLHDAPIIYNDHDYLSTLPSIQSFVVEDKAYIGLNGTADLWEFDPATGLWVKRAAFPGVPRYLGTGFEANGRIYFGTGVGGNSNHYDWWEYDVEQNLWTQKNSFGGAARAGAVAFRWGNNGYVGTGVTWGSFDGQDYTDIWLYLTELDIWLKMTDYPVHPLLDQGMWYGIALNGGGQAAYIGLGNSDFDEYSRQIFQYFPATNTWERIVDYPQADVDNFPIGFNLNGKTYIKTQYSKHFWSYNKDMNRWDVLWTDILTDVSTGIAFSIGDKAYVGLGRNKAMWEYDPSR